MKRIFLGMAILLVSACAPGLGNRMSVPAVPNPSSDAVIAITGEAIKLRVGSFMDGRASDAIAEVNGRAVRTDGQVGPVVQDAFERYYKAAGADVVLFNAPTIIGEITEWRTIVAPSFPSSEVTARARINVELRTPNEQTVYRASYAGESSAKNPMLDEDDIKDILAQAMASAVKEAVNDSSLLTRIARAGGRG